MGTTLLSKTEEPTRKEGKEAFQTTAACRWQSKSRTACSSQMEAASYPAAVERILKPAGLTILKPLTTQEVRIKRATTTTTRKARTKSRLKLAFKEARALATRLRTTTDHLGVKWRTK